MQRITLAVLAILGLALAGAAQINTGTIVGAVKDASGATIPGAAIAVTNRATGVTLRTVTDGSGQYQVPALTPGTYDVTASVKGFAPQRVENVVVDVQSRRLVTFTLKPGTVTQQVEVIASPPLLETQSAAVGSVMTTRQIADLPLNGRRYSDLALLAAGVSKAPNEEVANPAPDRFSANGNLEMQNYFTLDGTDNNSESENLQENSVQAVHPPPDALSEFKVQTRTYSAEFGTSAGAVVNASIKSGTNRFHGDVWDFLRNNKLDSNSFFNNASNTPNGHFSQNQFGGTIGGPIVRDRTFFFADFQGLLSSQATSVTSTVPTPLMKQGNFSELGASQLPLAAAVPGQANCVQADPNNGGMKDLVSSAAGCMDPVAQKLIALFPDPNVPAQVALQGKPGSFNGSNYIFSYAVPNHTYSTDVRIDHTIDASNQIFGRYSYEHQLYQNPPWTGNALAGNGDFATDFRIHDQSVAIGWTDALSSATVNQFHFGFSRVYAHSDPIGVTLGQSAAPQFGLTGIPVGPNTAGLPPIDINGLVRLGTSPWRPQWQISQVWQYVDTLSTIHGNHSFQFGYEYHRAADTFLDIQNPQGEINASGIYTNPASNVSFGLPDFLLGDVAGASFTTPLVAHNYYPGHALFAQDTWRARSNLTLTYGLRYELFSPVMDRNNELANFSPANGGTVVPVAPGASGAFARSTIHPDYKNFAPRIGFSYQMTPRLVWRGGYGIFYQHRDRIGSESMLNLNPPFLINATLSQQQGSTTPVFQLQNGFPAASFGPNLVQLDAIQIRAQDPFQRTPYVGQASFGPEIEIGHDTVLDLTAVGNWARKMNRLRDLNQGVVTGKDAGGNPVVSYQFANLNSQLVADQGAGQHAFLEYATNDGNTDYAGFEASLRRQYTHGLSYGLDYTFSHGLANFVDNLTGGALPQNAFDYGAEMGNSPFDVRHRFVANAIWDLPVGEGRRWLNQSGWANAVLGGWQANAILTLQTGIPFSIGASDTTDTGGNHASRPNCIGDPLAGASTDPGALTNPASGAFFMNPAAFANPQAGQFGSCAPRLLHGPGLENTDFSLFKNFRLSESKRVELRGEFFNAWNHPNFANPNSFFGGGGFGQISGTVGQPRQVQLALKIFY